MRKKLESGGQVDSRGSPSQLARLLQNWSTNFASHHIDDCHFCRHYLVLASVMPPFSSSTENELPVRQLSVHDHERTRVTPPTPSHTRVKNRRKRYLDLHLEYFGPSLELAGVLLRRSR